MQSIDNLTVHSFQTIPYKEAWRWQASLFEEMQSQSKENEYIGHLIFCEHPPVFTLGKNGQKENLLVSEERLEKEQIEIFQTDRGGDITYHGYGQLVVYPILDLNKLKIGIREYVDRLEEVIIQTLQSTGIHSGRIKGASGVWIEENRKICAIGIRASRAITMHGLALNVNTHLAHFEYITACGLEGKETTSIEKEISKKIALSEISQEVLKNFISVFELSER